MAKRKTPLEIGREADSQLPEFDDQSTALKHFKALRRSNRARLLALASKAGLDATSKSPASLETLDNWVSRLTKAELVELGTTLGELDFLVEWYGVSVILEHIPGARWIVQEGSFVSGHYSSAIQLGLGTWHSRTSFTSAAEYEWPWGRRGAPHFAHYSQLVASFSSDPMLHPAVLANQHRISKDIALGHCQTLTLAREIDAFDENEILVRIENPIDPWLDRLVNGYPAKLRAGEAPRVNASYRRMLIICLEDSCTYGPQSEEVLKRCAMEADVAGWQLALYGLFLRDANLGLSIALQRVGDFDRYPIPRLVDEIARHTSPQVVKVLAVLAERISSYEHSLWQSAESFGKVTGALWKWAQKGDSEAQTALKVVGRRWGRFSNETRAAVRLHARGLTQELAKSGGISLTASVKGANKKLRAKQDR